ncbi:MarR family transcriptional regulator [Mesorhizobium sp. LHD-90]|uniref:MarR family winged helix-turn-helix transcriptional regulator n=1 Tax=Mesorhizobium sp. LHD-90 TaxID=3071414 RepID=UPI0027DF6317|nr:MarR family transcriptional regulator [Mesorhizobium sp. LHD-90]MDQ6436656.1 MarR family transcriptional regulator [Mesorhizobium sp. LHD-90]
MDMMASRTAFVDELTKVNRKLRTMFDARVKSQGLTLARARLLMHLAKEEGATQSELAEALQVEQPSMVSLIDALEKKGFVVRRAVDGDRRAKGIFLTDVARRETDTILGYANELRQQVLGGVDGRDLETATRVLRRVALNIGAVA